MYHFPGGSDGKESACQSVQETLIRFLGQEDPLEKEMPTHSVSMPGESHGQRNLAGYSLWGRKESDTTEQLSIHTICAF